MDTQQLTFELYNTELRPTETKVVADILKEEFPIEFQTIYDNSHLLQYLDKKMKAVHGNSKTRRSLANIYAIYSILHFYQTDFYQNKAAYRAFGGYDYMRLFAYYRGLYGGSKLQNHALNSRVNGEFRNKFTDAANDLIIINNGKYLIHIDYIYVQDHDIRDIDVYYKLEMNMDIEDEE